MGTVAQTLQQLTHVAGGVWAHVYNVCAVEVFKRSVRRSNELSEVSYVFVLVC